VARPHPARSVEANRAVAHRRAHGGRGRFGDVAGTRAAFREAACRTRNESERAVLLRRSEDFF